MKSFQSDFNFALKSVRHTSPQKVFSEVTAGWAKFKLIHNSICLFLSNTFNLEHATFTNFSSYKFNQIRTIQ